MPFISTSFLPEIYAKETITAISKEELKQLLSIPLKKKHNGLRQY